MRSAVTFTVLWNLKVNGSFQMHLCARETKLQGFIHAVKYSSVQVSRPVGCQHHCIIPRLISCPEEERIQSTTESL